MTNSKSAKVDEAATWARLLAGDEAVTIPLDRGLREFFIAALDGDPPETYLNGVIPVWTRFAPRPLQNLIDRYGFTPDQYSWEIKNISVRDNRVKLNSTPAKNPGSSPVTVALVISKDELQLHGFSAPMIIEAKIDVTKSKDDTP